MKYVFSIIAALLLGQGAWAQIPNAGFETWVDTGGYNAPVNWLNLNALSKFYSIFTCEQGMPGYVGASYLKLTTKSTPLGPLPGLAVCSSFDLFTFDPTNGFASTARPANLTGVWQYAPSGDDTGHIFVLITRWNTAASKRDTIALTDHQLLGSVTTWTNFSIPLAYYSGEVPDSAIILLSSSAPGPINVPVPGSYLYVDNLSFGGNVPAGVTTVPVAAMSAIVYPNPASHMVTVAADFPAATALQLSVLDNAGRVIFSKAVTTASGHNKWELNTTGWAPGAYWVKMGDGTASTQKELVIQ